MLIFRLPHSTAHTQTSQLGDEGLRGLKAYNISCLWEPDSEKRNITCVTSHMTRVNAPTINSIYSGR